LDKSYDALETINGATTPQAVTLDASGRLILADADAVGRQSFLGFATNDVTGPGTPAVVGTPGTFAAGSNSVTAPAGTDLTMFVIDYAGDNAGGATLPTGMSYNSVAMTRVTTFNSGNIKIGLWALPLGTLGSPLVANVVSTGGSGANYTRYSVVIVSNAKQTAPYVATSAGNASSASSLSFAVSPSQLTGLAIIAGASRIAAWNNTTGGVTDISTATNTEVSTLPIANGTGFTASGASSPLNADSALIAFTVATAVPATQSIVRVLGSLIGFTGLTTGSDYYLGATAGGTTLTPTNGNVRVGVALSATKMYLYEKRPTVFGTAQVAPSSTQTITHGLGKAPETIRISGYGDTNTTGSGGWSTGGFTKNQNTCAYFPSGNGARAAGVSAVFAVRTATNSSGSEANVGTGIIQNVTATTFDIVWTGGSSAHAFIWEAQ
jgi:hypothetical protein